MPASPWTTIAALEPEREYLVMATRFIVSRHRHIPEVVRATQSLWPLLPASDGLLGYSLRAGFARRTLSTLTVWRDREALNAFVRGAAHTAVVEASRHRLARSTFVSWTAPGADLPPTWATADRHVGDQVRASGT